MTSNVLNIPVDDNRKEVEIAIPYTQVPINENDPVTKEKNIDIQKSLIGKSEDNNYPQSVKLVWKAKEVTPSSALQKNKKKIKPILRHPGTTHSSYVAEQLKKIPWVIEMIYQQHAENLDARPKNLFLLLFIGILILLHMVIAPFMFLPHFRDQEEPLSITLNPGKGMPAKLVFSINEAYFFKTETCSGVAFSQDKLDSDRNCFANRSINFMSATTFLHLEKDRSPYFTAFIISNAPLAVSISLAMFTTMLLELFHYHSCKYKSAL